ncbi:MAG: sulfotransferase family 2 domain-containing protein [Planctomycetota bacterium]|nr:sulfotransferase family 2 domain-containing protein [Planctomycetota bacterium]
MERESRFRSRVHPYSQQERATNTVFIHIPKTAGNSIARAVFGSDSGLGHDRARRYLEADPHRFAESFKFGIVRNPYDRLLSAHTYLTAEPIGWNDRAFRAAYLDSTGSFSEFVASLEEESVWGKVSQWTHFVPQHEFLCIGSALVVDLVGQFEDLDGALKRVSEVMRLGSVALPHLNASKGPKWPGEFTPAMKQIINHRYRRDFEMFGYELEA